MKTPRRFLCVLIILTLAVQSRGQTPRPVPQIQHAVIISVDGLRPDLLLRADTPSMHALYKSGTYTFWARTIPQAITLPSHVSMLTGVEAEKHKITFNKDPEPGQVVHPAVPTLFELAKKAGYSTAMVAGKSKFSVLARPGALDWSWLPTNGNTPDDEVARQAVGILREHHPDVLFVHFPGGDGVGHGIGWGTPQQIAVIEQIDRGIGLILQQLASDQLTATTVIILSADHGGAGKNHGPDDPRSRHIPWIIAGPGIRQNLDLTTYQDLTVNTEDTFATVCYLLGIPMPGNLDGKPIRQALDRAELLEAK